MKRRTGIRALLVAAAGALAVSASTLPAQAADSGQTIRVALFIDIGKGYRGVVPDVTLVSDPGLSITLSGPGASVALPENAHEARFRVDEFSLLAAETPDLNEAQRVAQQLSQKKQDASIVVAERGGGRLYQVWSGSFATYSQAAAQAKTVAQAIGRNPEVKGPYRLDAGTFFSLDQAKHVQTALALAGLPAYLVEIPQGNRVAYAVWVGDEVSPEGANQLAPAARAALAGPNYQPADTKKPYALIRDEVAAAGGGAAETIHQYAFSSAAKVVVKPRKGSGVPVISVEEREHRKYRGQIELSEYMGHLTVVNELPVEQYLYGVVGSEMASGWPLEALKAQAVLARTRALEQGNKYGIAQVSDTVYEQAYYGYTREADDIRRAVDETAGQVIRYQGKLVSSLFYSNAGGMTASGVEVWGHDVPYLASVASDDQAPMRAAKTWYRVALPDGAFGYLRSDLVDVSPGRNALGFQEGYVNTDNANFRSGPSTTYHKALRTLPQGTQVTILGSEPEENAYVWTRGPYTSAEMTAMLNASQKSYNAPQFSGVRTLEVTQRGPSGRVLKVEADGIPVAASYPDAYRSVFRQGDQSLRSTKFDIEQMGSFAVLGAGGQLREYPADDTLFAVGAGGYEPVPANGDNDQFLILRRAGAWRVAAKQPMFLIRGYGFGHGLGVSQFGAKAMAEKGYDYLQILQHYYKDVTIGP